MSSTAARRRRLHLLAASVASAALLAAPALASAAACPDVPVAQAFASFGDTSDYFLAPDGAFEQGAAGWTLSGGAHVAGGSEPWGVVGPDGRRSLQLTPGSSATSAAFCVGAEHRSLRFFTKGAAKSEIDLDVLYEDTAGVRREQPLATIDAGGGWAPTGAVAMVVNELAAEHGGALSVSLRFTARGKGAAKLDDVLIDPYRGR